MIVDIVPLPRRLKNIKRREESISSEEVVCLPIPTLSRSCGYWQPDDTAYIGFGGWHPVITGKDVPFRYKFIEPTKFGTAEYFVVTTSPINILQPWLSKNVQLICPWVTLSDPKTLTVRKFILWNGIFDLMHFETEDNISDTPIEAVIVNELRNLAKSNYRDDLIESLKEYPSDCSKLYISEEKMDEVNSVDNLSQLQSNILAYGSMLENEDPCYWCDIGDVVKGVKLPHKWNYFPELCGCTFLNHVLYGKTTLGGIRHLFGLTYDAHAYQRVFINKELDPGVELSIYDNSNPDLFGVLKYVERLPYSEFVIEINGGNGVPSMTIMNPHDVTLKLKNEVPPSLRDSVNQIVNALKSGYPEMIGAKIIRSWEECVYITIMNTDDSKQSFYFDLISASLGSRVLVRDYDPQFGL